MPPRPPRRLRPAGRFASAFALALLLAAPAAALDQSERQQRFQDGVRAFDAGDYAAAKEAWLPLARNDDPAAQRNLAHLYRRGLGVAPDFAEAAKWYERAADLGLASAQVNLAMMYIRGQGVAQDYGRAAEWLDLAARQGHVLAQYNLALLYWRGLGIEKSEPRALGWLYLAARAGHEGALEKLGQLVQELPGPAAAAGQPQAVPAAPAATDEDTPNAGAHTAADAAAPADADESKPDKATPAAPAAAKAPADAGASAGPLSLLSRLLSSPDEDELDDAPVAAGLSREERLEVGRAAYLEGDYAHARAMWLGLARKGDGEAQYLMGSLYAEPRFADANRTESYRWYYLASLNGHAGATETLQQLDRQISAEDRRAAMALVRGDDPPPASDK